MTTTAQAITALKQQLGDALCIVGHHYQAQSVIDHCQVTGDSLELARKVAAITAPHIVFCGVYFMGESAALLARDGQNIYLPETAANCVMSQMTPADRVEAVLTRLTRDGRKIIPLAYVNTSLAVKAVVGRFGGAVCTSANARTMLEWAFGAGDGVLFLPDKNLARNTARQLGMDERDWHMLDIRRNGDAVDVAQTRKAQLLLWPGCCAIHAKFTPETVRHMRAAHPGCTVVVHPECAPETVQAADGAGSTSYLIKYVAQTPQGSTVVVGTETNLVDRLRAGHAGVCQVERLRRAYCSHMGKVTADKVLATLQGIAQGTANPVCIPQQHKAPARAALQTMLDVCATAGV